MLFHAFWLTFKIENDEKTLIRKLSQRSPKHAQNAY